jgi:hypothetical protein
MPFSPPAEKQIKKSYTRAPATHKRRQALQETLQKYALQNTLYRIVATNLNYENALPQERITKNALRRARYTSALPGRITISRYQGRTLRTHYTSALQGHTPEPHYMTTLSFRLTGNHRRGNTTAKYISGSRNQARGLYRMAEIEYTSREGNGPIWGLFVIILTYLWG